MKTKMLSAVKEFVGFTAAFLIVFMLVKAAESRYAFNFIDSGSMLPSLKVGALTVTDTKAYDFDRKMPKEGDIIIYRLTRPDGTLLREVAHRVVGVNDDGTYTTKGDNNGTPDGWEISPDHIVGKVVFYTNIFSSIYSSREAEEEQKS